MLGGAIGALLRYIVSNRVYDWLGRDFPYGTLTVNVAGSFLMGFLTILIIDRGNVDPAIKLGLLVGFLGAFTTFSTFSLDTLNLFEEGAFLRAFMNIFLSIFVCVTAVWVGILTGKQL
jgi:CrcB protein